MFFRYDVVGACAITSEHARDGLFALVGDPYSDFVRRCIRTTHHMISRGNAGEYPP
jgi:hypothetical protein